LSVLEPADMVMLTYYISMQSYILLTNCTKLLIKVFLKIMNVFIYLLKCETLPTVLIGIKICTTLNLVTTKHTWIVYHHYLLQYTNKTFITIIPLTGVL
jgi:hypothetical protein